MAKKSRDFPHLYVERTGTSEPYESSGRGSSGPPPERDREAHARFLEEASCDFLPTYLDLKDLL